MLTAAVRYGKQLLLFHTSCGYPNGLPVCVLRISNLETLTILSEAEYSELLKRIKLMKKNIVI